MPVIYVPFHLDEHHPDLDVPLPADTDVTEVTVGLPQADVWSRLAFLYDAVANAVESAVRAETVPLVVSGDCTVSIGLTAGLQRAGIEPSIVWLDAHGDLQTFETTPSGYVGGMALRFLLGYRHERIGERICLRPPDEDRVLLVDARDLDPAEIDYLASARVRRLPLEELSAAALPAGPLLVNLDLDILDPADLPGVRYPAAKGPHPPALRRAVRTVLDSGRVAALNLACTWRPDHDDSDGSRERVVSSILTDLLDRT